MRMMTKITSAGILFLLIATLAFAASPEQEIRALLDEFLQAAGRGDRAIFDRFFADDLLYTRSAGETITKPEIMKSLPEAPLPPSQQTERYRAEDVKVQLYGSTALVAFRLVQETREGAHFRESARFRNSAAFLKRDGRWQATLWQATRIPEEAGSAELRTEN